MFHYTVESDKTIETVLKTLDTNLQADKFGVQWEFDVKQTLENKGFSLDKPFTVLEVCNPKAADTVMHINPMVGYFLPCKLAVYENEAGKTQIGMPKPTVLMAMLDDDRLKPVAEDIENRLIKIIDESK